MRRGGIPKIFWSEDCLVDWIGSMREREESSMILRFLTWAREWTKRSWAETKCGLGVRETRNLVWTHEDTFWASRQFETQVWFSGKGSREQICEVESMPCHIKPQYWMRDHQGSKYRKKRGLDTEPSRFRSGKKRKGWVKQREKGPPLGGSPVKKAAGRQDRPC